MSKGHLILPIFFECDYCKEFFHIEAIILENNQDHCPYCGSIVKQALPHTSRKGK